LKIGISLDDYLSNNLYFVVDIFSDNNLKLLLSYIYLIEKAIAFSSASFTII